MSKLPRSTILLPVFVPAAIIMLLLVIGTAINPEAAGALFSDVLSFTTETFGWFYMLAVALFLMFIIVLAFSSYGSIKLGPDHAEAEYGFLEWFAMLFSAGYGIALLFYGVAEPVMHFSSPPMSDPQTIAAAKEAMQIAYFHWGFHIWAIYGVVGLSLAYFAFRHGLPLSIRSTLYPIIGDRIHGPIGHTVDVFAILGTMFGIATSLGLSVSQINAGLNYLLPDIIPVNTTVQVIAIALVTAAALVSVLAGMDKGVKRLSILNMLLATALMLFVFVVGPTIFILNAFMENTGSYLGNIVERTFSLQAYENSNWIGSWTLFIFAWTIAWAPFVGLFIAKISRGRTIREFVLGVMLVPTFFTFFWFSVFGDTALHMIMVDGYTSLISEVQNNQAIALFKLLENLPFTEFVSSLTILLIITFFVTSSDSGSLVIDSLAAGGRSDTPWWQRSFWVVTEGAVAAVLLLAGGLEALQTAAIVSALPFAIIILISMFGMWRALRIEGHRNQSLGNDNRLPPHLLKPSAWRERIDYMTDKPTREKVLSYIKEVVMPSMMEVSSKFAETGWTTEVNYDAVNNRAVLELQRGDDVEFWYEVRLSEHDAPDYYTEDSADTLPQEHHHRAEVYLRRGGQTYDLYGYKSESVINDIIDQFEKYLHFLNVSPDSLPWRMQEHDDDITLEQGSVLDK
ncbi:MULTISPECIES: BCCT family transporter [Psychrobacter]|jgi:choline/glycine/proline betaine transport protein|uniref:BCCT family transporter n=1 Tax=Psychrobacter TaxID=497 RepID=UPI00168D2025|nr:MULTISPECIES: BCCT family transporter [Psychrobacter]MCG3841549.1 BCCT family transporter [Psychrobacter sp. Ps1]MCG3859683.1 BCCT family transporter [Psychrobacter sp. Ps2]MDN3441150.1 BCCT family transporter [Psychrobacter sp. APC 3279]MDN3446918.1 BCCT family transporter [Psychrobacter sp. APC 3281]QOD13658.1 BCCT family transporter [Psychrobacter sp. 28M-43]